MNGDRWIFRRAIEARLGSFPNAKPGVLSPEGELLAEVSAKAMSARQANRFQASLGRSLGMVVGSYRTSASRLVENPSLARHTGKPARWHITSDTGEPLADVYFGIQADAGKLARLLANLRRQPVRVYDNAGLPPHLSAHRDAGSYSPNPNPKRRNPIPRSIDRRSIRTLKRGGQRILIGCPKGEYQPRKGRCKVGTRKVNPHDPLERHYKSEKAFREALTRYSASGELVDWFADDFDWVIRLRRIVPSGRQPNPKGRKADRETQLAAQLVKELGFDAMAADVLSGEYSVARTFEALLAMPGLSESRKILVRTALTALTRGYGSTRETAAAGRAARAAQKEEMARAARHPANRMNPSYRVSGTIEEIPDAPPVARRGPGRPRKVRVAPVELAAKLDPIPFEVPAEAPGRELQAGDRVTVPYSGRASYFGRAVKHTRESGIFEGYTYENDQRLAFVRVIRGHSVETHAFPVDQVRLHGKSFAEHAAAGRAGRPAKLARLTWKAHGSLAKAEAMLEKATAEHAATEALAMELYPQHEAQPGRPRGRTEAASRDYTNARAKLRRLTERVELLGSVVRSLGGGGTVALGYGEATGTDPWAANRRRRIPNRRGPKHGASGTPRTVRGVKRKRNPRGSEYARAVKTYQMWHEFDPHRVTRMKGPDRLIPRTLVKLGDIRSIDYISDKYEGRPVTYTHQTDRPRPVLATDPDGRNLHIVGGRIKITADGLEH